MQYAYDSLSLNHFGVILRSLWGHAQVTTPRSPFSVTFGVSQSFRVLGALGRKANLFFVSDV